MKFEGIPMENREEIEVAGKKYKTSFKIHGKTGIEIRRDDIAKLSLSQIPLGIRVLIIGDLGNYRWMIENIDYRKCLLWLFKTEYQQTFKFISAERHMEIERTAVETAMKELEPNVELQKTKENEITLIVSTALECNTIKEMQEVIKSFLHGVTKEKEKRLVNIRRAVTSKIKNLTNELPKNIDGADREMPEVAINWKEEAQTVQINDYIYQTGYHVNGIPAVKMPYDDVLRLKLEDILSGVRIIITDIPEKYKIMLWRAEEGKCVVYLGEYFKYNTFKEISWYKALDIRKAAAEVVLTDHECMTRKSGKSIFGGLNEGGGYLIVLFTLEGQDMNDILNQSFKLCRYIDEMSSKTINDMEKTIRKYMDKT